MPFMGVPLGPAEKSTQAGSFFGSVVNVPEAESAPPGMEKTDFPSAVSAQVVPVGGSSRLPPMTALSTAHSPTTDASFLGGSLAPGAPTVRARAVNADEYIGFSGGIGIGFPDGRRPPVAPPTAAEHSPHRPRRRGELGL